MIVLKECGSLLISRFVFLFSDWVLRSLSLPIIRKPVFLSLLGNSVTKPPRWQDLHRHMHFGMLGDLHDIIEHDWPSVKAGLRKSMYGESEPVPVEVEDLGDLVSTKPRGSVATKLRWESLTDEEFERLVFALISSERGYENPEWLMKTNAPDRGRDLSVWTSAPAESSLGNSRQTGMPTWYEKRY